MLSHFPIFIHLLGIKFNWMVLWSGATALDGNGGDINCKYEDNIADVNQTRLRQIHDPWPSAMIVATDKEWDSNIHFIWIIPWDVKSFFKQQDVESTKQYWFESTISNCSGCNKQQDVETCVAQISISVKTAELWEIESNCKGCWNACCVSPTTGTWNIVYLLLDSMGHCLRLCLVHCVFNWLFWPSGYTSYWREIAAIDKIQVARASPAQEHQTHQRLLRNVPTGWGKP